MEVKRESPLMSARAPMKHPWHEMLTARLVGRPPVAADFTFLRILHADPRVTATLSAEGAPFAEDATRRALDSAIDHWRRHGFGVRYFFERESGDFVGYCGLRFSVLDGRNEIELLYAVRADRWRKGYGAEMARAALTEGFERMGFRDIVAFTLPVNAGSRGVMERCGMRLESDIVHAGLPHVLYRIRQTYYA
jgi:RimJ/RimL family protein N-acetyltransferase